MRRLAALTALALLVALPMAPAAAAGTDRLAGDDRIGTAVAISQRGFPDGAAAVYLARADVLSDALAAGSLTDGPVLLVPPCGEVPAAVTAEVQRLDPDEVVALGGNQAVCDELLDEVGEDAGTSRLAGDSRFDTAVAIAERAFPDGADTVYLADAADSPDAVAGGSLTDGPTLLVPSDGAPDPAVVAAVATLDPGEVVALGGTAAVADDVLAAAAAGRPVGRLAGDSRFDTAAAIAGRSFPATAPVVYIARADVFADAVAAGTLTDGPVLLVPSCGDVPPAVTDTLTRLAPATVIALGGTAAVCDELLATAAGQQPPPPPDDGLGPIAYESTTVPPGALESVTNIWTIQPDGTGAERLTTTSGIENRQRRPKWSPDGRYLAWLDVGANGEFGSTDLMALDTTDPALTPRRVFDDVALFGFDCTDFRYDYVWSQDASTVAVRCMAEPAGYTHSLAVVRLDGSAATVIPFSGPDVFGIVSVAMSPDGSRAVYTEASDTLGGVRVADLSAGSVPGVEFGISGDDLLWSPGGDLIAYGAGGGGTEIRVVAPDGSGDRPVATSPDYVAPVGWSPDGTALYAESVVQDPPGTFYGAVERVDVATGTRTQVVRSELGTDGTDVLFGGVSPDGDRLVVGYQQGDLDDPISGNLAVVDADGTDLLPFPAPQGRDLDPVWRPSGAAAAAPPPPSEPPTQAQPDALAATEQRIRDEVVAPSGLNATTTCPDVPVLRRGDVHECAVELQPPDENAAENAIIYVIVRDDAGGTTFEYGNAAPYTLDDFAAEGFGPDTLCRDFAASGTIYFYAALYWFRAGEPDRMDADLNGVPCETVYPAEAINGFWTGAPLGSYDSAP